MRTVDFQPDLVDAFRALPDDGGPVSMLNLLRFRERADYTGHPEQAPCSGREAYGRYMELALPIVESAAGSIVFMGTCFGRLIAPEDEHWDDMLLLEYPTRGPFIEAVTSERYGEISFHRTAALLDSRIIGFNGGRSSFMPAAE